MKNIAILIILTLFPTICFGIEHPNEDGTGAVPIAEFLEQAAETEAELISVLKADQEARAQDGQNLKASGKEQEVINTLKRVLSKSFVDVGGYHFSEFNVAWALETYVEWIRFGDRRKKKNPSDPDERMIAIRMAYAHRASGIIEVGKKKRRAEFQVWFTSDYPVDRPGLEGFKNDLNYFGRLSSHRLPVPNENRHDLSGCISETDTFCDFVLTMKETDLPPRVFGGSSPVIIHGNLGSSIPSYDKEEGWVPGKKETAEEKALRSLFSEEVQCAASEETFDQSMQRDDQYANPAMPQYSKRALEPWGILSAPYKGRHGGQEIIVKYRPEFETPVEFDKRMVVIENGAPAKATTCVPIHFEGGNFQKNHANLAKFHYIGKIQIQVVPVGRLERFTNIRGDNLMLFSGDESCVELRDLVHRKECR